MVVILDWQPPPLDYNCVCVICIYSFDLHRCLPVDLVQWLSLHDHSWQTVRIRQPCYSGIHDLWLLCAKVSCGGQRLDSSLNLVASLVGNSWSILCCYYWIWPPGSRRYGPCCWNQHHFFELQKFLQKRRISLTCTQCVLTAFFHYLHGFQNFMAALRSLETIWNVHTHFSRFGHS